MKRNVVASTLFLLSLVACGGSAPPAEPAKSAAPPRASTPVETPAPGLELPRSHLKRYEERPGEFFQSVDFDEHAVFADGKFHGLRIAALRDGLERTGIKPGDVITSVNRLPIERPEYTVVIIKSLEKAKEVRVEYERDGEQRVVTVPIIDDVPATSAPPPASGAPASGTSPAQPTKP